MKKRTKMSNPNVVAIPFNPNQLRADIPVTQAPIMVTPVQSAPIKDNIPQLNVRETILPYINAEVKNFNETPFFVPVKCNEYNLVTGADEPYLGVVKDTVEHYIENYDGGPRNLGEGIANICEDHFTNVLISNMNIIFSDGLFSMIFNYSMTNYTDIMKLYTKLIQDNFITGYFGAKAIFRNLIFEKNRYGNLRKYHQSKDEMVEIMAGCNEIRVIVIKLISSVIYQFLNTVVFNGYINTTRFNADILNDFSQAATDGQVSFPIEEIKSSAPSMVLQYLLEMANIDINKIAEISDVIYITVINQMLKEIYLAQNYACIQPLKPARKADDDDYDY